LVLSRAADPLTQMHMLEIGYFDEYTTSESMMQVRTYASFAVKSTYNLTNQLLRAKMDGRHLLLVSMDTNGLSAT
jgi:hypothetical protein